MQGVSEKTAVSCLTPFKSFDSANFKAILKPTSQPNAHYGLKATAYHKKVE
jgi:hypothetical protein